MIWIDIATPKYALFFSKMLPYLKKIEKDILIITRYSINYDEVTKLMELLGLKYHVLGNYGGSSTKDKFNARLKRQSEFVDIFEKRGYPQALLCGSSVEGVQTAFGLGIPIIHFADTPIKGYTFKYEDMTILSKLTIPLSSLVFHPFVIPRQVYVNFGLSPENVIAYDFIDVCLWMDEIELKEENDFRKKYELDSSKPTILIREEEYKAHYVTQKVSLIYNLIPKIANEIDCNIVIMPRYESEYLKKSFGKFATILEEKLTPQEFYPFIDLLVGGGGTMNLEAAYYGIPVISTRSLLLYHDVYLLENDLMWHVTKEKEALSLIRQKVGKFKNNKQFFCQGNCSFETIMKKIEKFLKDTT